MKSAQRQAIAALAACLTGRCNSGELIDDESNLPVNLKVMKRADHLEIMDQHYNLLLIAEHKYFKWSIFDQRTSRYMELEESGKDYKGYDYDSAHYFTLQMDKNKICIYDFESDDYHYFHFNR